MKKKSTLLTALYFVICILALDISSKFLTQAYLPHHLYSYPYGGIGIFKNFYGIEFSIVHATNKGAAWGMLSEWQHYLLYLRIVLVILLLGYILFFNKNKSYEIPLAFILAGAAGNILDFFLYGHVIDMLHFVFWGYDYPVFNLADSSIFIGIAWLLILSWKEKPKAANGRL